MTRSCGRDRKTHVINVYTFDQCIRKDALDEDEDPKEDPKKEDPSKQFRGPSKKKTHLTFDISKDALDED